MIIAPVVANPRRVPAGSILVISCETRTNAGVLTTPGTSISIEIYDPSGDTAQASTAMTTASTGVHSYTFATTTTREPGSYTFKVVAVHTDGTTVFRNTQGSDSSFEVW